MAKLGAKRAQRGIIRGGIKQDISLYTHRETTESVWVAWD